MTRFAFLVFGIVLLLAPTPIAAQERVEGSVHATWREPQRISGDVRLVLRAGHVATVTVQGEVDLNQERKSRRECGWFGLDCETVEWTEHHPATPQAAPVRVLIREVGRAEPVASVVVGGAPAAIAVPLTDQNFQTAYEVVAILDGTGTWIAPGRSAGSFKVLVEIDAGPRAERLAGWLNAERPPVATATGTNVIDTVTATTRGDRVAAALRAHAVSVYPITDATRRPAHETLIRKAIEVAPLDTDNYIALAAVLRASGLTIAAENELRQVLSQLQNRTDPASRRQLGIAYEALADMTLARGGGLGAALTQEAASHLQQAIVAYRGAGRRDLEARALVKQGRLWRGMRTIAAMQAAISSFEQVRGLLPESVRGRTGVAAGAFAWAMDVEDGFEVSDIPGGGASLRVADAYPIAWDPFGERMLIGSGVVSDNLFWRTLDSDQRSAAPAVLPASVFQAASGAILLRPRGDQLFYSAPNGTVTALSAGNGTSCAEIPPGALAGLSPGYIDQSLGRDGTVLASVCGTKVRAFEIRDSVPVQVREETVSIPPGTFWPRVFAGPRQCGVAVVTAPAMPPTLRLFRIDGSVVTVTLPRAAFLPVPPGMPPGTQGFAQDWPLEISFTGDNRMLVARGSAQIEVYDCARGTLETPLQLIPLLTAANAARPPIRNVNQRVMLRWVTPDLLAVIDTARRTVTQLSWPSRTVRQTEVAETLNDNDLQRVLFSPMPPAAGRNELRIARSFRRVTARQSPQDNQNPWQFEAPGFANPVRALSAGNYLLVDQGLEGVALIARSGETPARISDARLAAAGEQADMWSFFRALPGSGRMLNLAPYFDAPPVSEAVLMRGASVVRTLPLPSITADQRAATVSALQAFQAFRRAQPAVPPEQIFTLPGLLPSARLAEVIDHPDRIINRHALLVPIRALATPNGLNATIVCTVPTASLPGGEVLGFEIPVPGSAMLAVIRNDRLDTSPIPLRPAQPPSAPSCPGVSVIPGPDPAVMATDFTNQTLQLRRLVNGQWVDISGIAMPAQAPVGFYGPIPASGIVAGWALPNGDILAATLGGTTGSYAIKRISRTGATVDACPACGALRLEDALNRLAGNPGATPQGFNISRNEYRLRSGTGLSLILTDAAGRLLIYPDGEDSVVWSIAAGRELLRVPLGLPTLLRSDLLIMADGQGMLQSYRLSGE